SASRAWAAPADAPTPQRERYRPRPVPPPPADAAPLEGTAALRGEAAAMRSVDLAARSWARGAVAAVVVVSVACVGGLVLVVRTLLG
ncbi:hypothetical protein, partial [Cellulomonas shaoxiangyii]